MTRVVVDVQGTQTIDHRDRGIARFISELSSALAERHPDLVGAFLLNPDLNPPGRLERLVASGKLTHHDRYTPSPSDGAYHVMSPFEASVPARRLWPPFAHQNGLRLVVTVYDLIPEVFAWHYLTDPGVRRRYRARQQLVRAADLVLVTARSTAKDVTRLLGVASDRIVYVGAGVSERFSPAASPAAAWSVARGAVPGLEQDFVLYTGGMEWRKNIDRLVEAYARLPRPVRDRHQLVIACQADEGQREHWSHRTAELGIYGRLLLTGFVPEDALPSLYQAAHLFVFPSLYEGFGLPVLEAMACGVPTIAARSSSLVELVEEEALFDPEDVAGIAAALRRGLTDDGYRSALSDRTRQPMPGWGDVADRTAEAYRHLLGRRPRAPRRRPDRRIAVVTPLPPQPSGVARYSALLLESLRTWFPIDVFLDGLSRKADAPADLRVYDSVEHLDLVEATDGPYQRVLYCLGNSVFHARAVGALRRRPGVVLAHDVRLIDLYIAAAHRPRSTPEGFHAALQRMYAGRVPAQLGAPGFVTREEADRWGVYMAKEAIACSERFLVNSEFAARLARLDADPAHRDRIGVVPFSGTAPWWGDRDDTGVPVIASFGIANEVKQNLKLVEAFALLPPRHRDATLAIVGPAGQTETDAIRAAAEALGVAERVVITDEVPYDEYEAWLVRARLAVQLRAGTNGESSGTIRDCMAYALPTVVTAIGPAAELPDDCVAKVPPAIPPADLARVLGDLLDDPPRRRAMGEAARAYAAAHDFEAVAERIARVLLDDVALSA